MWRSPLLQGTVFMVLCCSIFASQATTSSKTQSGTSDKSGQHVKGNIHKLMQDIIRNGGHKNMKWKLSKIHNYKVLRHGHGKPPKVPPGGRLVRVTGHGTYKQGGGKDSGKVKQVTKDGRRVVYKILRHGHGKPPKIPPGGRLIKITGQGRRTLTGERSGAKGGTKTGGRVETGMKTGGGSRGGSHQRVKHHHKSGGSHQRVKHHHKSGGSHRRVKHGHVHHHFLSDHGLDDGKPRDSVHHFLPVGIVTDHGRKKQG